MFLGTLQNSGIHNSGEKKGWVNCYFCFLCAKKVWKYDRNIGPFPSKNRSSCSCEGYTLNAQHVPADELEDLQRRRSQEYRQYQLRSKNIPLLSRCFYISAFSKRFYPKRLTIAFRLYIFNQYLCSLGIEPTTFCAADAMLYHWATQEHNF